MRAPFLLFVKFLLSLPQLRGATSMLRSALARDGAGGEVGDDFKKIIQ